MFAVRLGLPLVILRRPVLGGFLAILADLSDILIFNIWGWPPCPYHQLDKALDLYYLAIEGWVALRWASWERGIALGLFAWRLAGVAAFELTGWRGSMLVFPNLFEWWWLLVVLRDRFWPGYCFTPRRSVTWLLALLLLKEAQEYALHSAQWLDHYVLSDVVRSIWRQLTG